MKTYEKYTTQYGGYASGNTYDLLLFNNATKQGYVFRNLYDSGEETYYQFNYFSLEGLPFGEYSYALICNTNGYAEYNFKDNLLDTTIQNTNLTVRDLHPVLGLLKYVDDTYETQQEEPQYRDKDTEFVYRKKG